MTRNISNAESKTQVPTQTKWEITAKALTAALTQHLDSLYSLAGKDEYNKIISKIWAGIGQETARGAMEMGLPNTNALEVAEAGAIMCQCGLGPEYKIEPAQTTKKKAVMKIVKCPFNNRLNDQKIKNDVMSRCDVAFWKHFVATLNPKVVMRHGKQMHKGDAYCEWIFEMSD